MYWLHLCMTMRKSSFMKKTMIKFSLLFLVQPALSNIVSLVRKIEHCEDVRPFFTNGAEYTLKNMQYVLMHQPKNIQQYFNAAIRENYAGAAVRHVKPDCP